MDFREFLKKNSSILFASAIKKLIKESFSFAFMPLQTTFAADIP
jgi:hypothetical protein